MATVAETRTTGRHCTANADCLAAATWLYVAGYSNDEGYIREWACDAHLPPSVSDATPVKCGSDGRRASGIGWPPASPPVQSGGASA